MLVATPYIGLAAGIAGGGSIAFVTSAASSAATITVPASVVAGDILVLTDRASNTDSSTPPTTVVPTGFTSINNVTGTDGVDADRQILSYKLADGTEASTSLTGMDDNGEEKVLLVFRGTPTILSVSVNDIDGDMTDNSSPPANQTILASAGTPPLVALAAFGQWLPFAGKSVFDPSLTPEDAEVAGPTNGAAIAYHIQNETGADAVASLNASDNFFQSIQTCYIQKVS